MRPRKQDRHLPACMYHKHGSYWLVKKGQWANLGKDHSEALQEYARRQAQPPPPKNGMPELIDKVLAVHLKRTAKNTASQYQSVAQRLKTMLAEFEPQQVKAKHIAAIKINLADKPRTCNQFLSLLNIVFSYALEWEIVESNPCTGIRKHKEKPRTRYITHDEFNALLSCLPERMQNLFSLVYLTGQRIRDVLNLHQDNITQDGIAFVQQKTQTKMLIGITDDIAELLNRIKPNPNGWLFYNHKTGSALNYSTAQEAFARARSAAGIQDVTIRDLRAKSLTDADEQGKNAQKLGGHKNASTTRLYLRGRKPIQATAPTLPKKTKVLDNQKKSIRQNKKNTFKNNEL